MNFENIDNLCMNCFKPLGRDNAFCTACGYPRENESSSHHLRPRSILNGKYLVGRVLGEGGFGITYIGWDLNLEIKVAIKEYYPSGFVTREVTATTTVQPYTGTQGEFFLKGRDRFVEEARSLAKFRAMPGIVAVSDFFAENGTAYIVMEYIDGQTLKSYLAKMGGKLPAAQVFDMMRPVMSSLAQVHTIGMIHRDISPDNIMISKEGYVKLLDFGAAREFAEAGNKSLSIMLKPGFAPEEQYRSRGNQGPWTDVYALSATMYKAITGITPDESSERMRLDTVKKPSELGIPIAPAQEAALMKGMAVLQENRWQSMDELARALSAVPPSQASIPVPPSIPAPTAPQANWSNSQGAAPSGWGTPPVSKKAPWSRGRKTTVAVAGAVAGIIIIAVVIGIIADNADSSGYSPSLSEPAFAPSASIEPSPSSVPEPSYEPSLEPSYEPTPSSDQTVYSSEDYSDKLWDDIDNDNYTVMDIGTEYDVGHDVSLTVTDMEPFVADSGQGYMVVKLEFRNRDSYSVGIENYDLVLAALYGEDDGSDFATPDIVTEWDSDTEVTFPCEIPGNGSLGLLCAYKVPIDTTMTLFAYPNIWNDDSNGQSFVVSYSAEE